MAHTILVNIDIDIANKLITYLTTSIPSISSSPSFQSECEQFISSSQIYEFICHVLNYSDQMILQSTLISSGSGPNSNNKQDDNSTAATPNFPTEKVIEGCFDAIFTILFSLQNPTQFNAIVQLIIQKLTNNTQEKTSLRLRILVNFYNLLISVENKLTVLKAILQYSLETKQTKQILHFHSSVMKWTTHWNLSSSDQRDLFLLLSKITQIEKLELVSFEYLIKYFNSFGDAEAQLTEEGIQIAINTILKSIQSSVIAYSERHTLYCSLSKLQIRNQQEASSSSSATLLTLIELLSLVVKGDISGFNSFIANSNNATLLSTHQVSTEQLLHSLKLLILCNLAAKSSNNTTQSILSYESVATSLHISEDEVEEWVVEAISNKLIEASMDQLNKIVVVSKSIRFSFERDQWLALQSKVDHWRDSIATLSDLLKKRNHQQA